MRRHCLALLVVVGWSVWFGCGPPAQVKTLDQFLTRVPWRVMCALAPLPRIAELAAAGRLDRVREAADIDLAISLRDSLPHLPQGRFAEAYAKYGQTIGAVAAKDWKTSDVSEPEREALNASERARTIDLAAVFQKACERSCSGRLGEAWPKVEKSIKQLLERDWAVPIYYRGGVDAVESLFKAHTVDVAMALGPVAQVVKDRAFLESYAANKTTIEDLARQSQGFLLRDAWKALCEVLVSYAKGRGRG